MILIDVRTKGEYEAGHIDGAIHHDVMAMVQGVFPDIDTGEQITLYCESGARSRAAKMILERAGFKRVKDAGGIDNLR
jgi:phage shock protein E